MSAAASTGVAIVGAGVAGTLVARELVEAEMEVTVLERGGHVTHAEQLRTGAQAADIPSAAPNHESHPETPDDRWDYVYGVGGSGLHWGGVTPRFLPSDFELRSRFGVGRDWPLTYTDLEPFYILAERALGVAGGPNPLFGRTYRPPLPAHPPAPLDRMLEPYLRPYFTLPQARPTRSIDDRPACCAAGRCGLCPVDARYSPLHTLDRLHARTGFKLQARTVVTRLRRDGRSWALELATGDGERSRLLARTVVLAANGVENAALLLRSGLGGEDVGRWLSDHEHVQYRIEVAHPAAAGRGSSIGTGISYAWADGDWRSRRGSQLAYPDNRGLYMGHSLVDAVTKGLRGSALRRTIADRFERTVLLDTSGEDLPQGGRYVELSPRRDVFGLPLNRLRYPADSPYLERARQSLRADLERRLRPLGARMVDTFRYRGGHQLGTCRMGQDDGVVDPDCRVHGERGVYAVGGSAFPSYSAAHPTLTIAALAIRLGGHLANGGAQT